MARPCLDDNAALALLEGRLASAERGSIERHLEGCDACRELVTELVKVGGAMHGSMQGTIDRPVDTDRVATLERKLAPGSLLGPYRLETTIGSGSAGIVYRAADAHGRVVALKYVTDPGLRARFTREASTLARLDHDAIVRYIGHGDVGSGMYLAMEWLEGEDLQQHLSRGPLGWEGTRSLGLRLTAALAHAHALGCVHRDLSPRNVFLPMGRIELAKLLDFGLVRVDTGELARTATNAVLGTPYYMSPEQIRDPKNVTGRSDLFGLGVLMFEAISGVRPFQGDDLFTLWQRIIHLPAPDLRTATAGTNPRAAREIPEPLVRLVAALLAKDPLARPASASVVMSELQSMSRAAPLLVVPSSRPPATPPGFVEARTEPLAPPIVLPAPPPFGALPTAPPPPPPFGASPTALPMSREPSAPPAVTVPPGGRPKAVPIALLVMGLVVVLLGLGAVGMAQWSGRAPARTVGSAPPPPPPSMSRGEREEGASAAGAKSTFPLVCPSSGDLEATGTWKGNGPIITSVTGNCKIVLRHARLEGTTLFQTHAANVELTLEDVVIDTTDDLATSGGNFVVRMRKSTLRSKRGGLRAGPNFDLPDVVDSVIEADDVAIRGDGMTTFHGEGVRVRSRRSAIVHDGSLTMHLDRASEITSRDEVAIRPTLNFGLTMTGGTIEGPRGAVVTGSNPELTLDGVTVTSTTAPAIAGGIGAKISAKGSTITAGETVAIAIDSGDVTLVGSTVRGGEAAVSGKNMLVLEAKGQSNLVATSGTAIVATTNAIVELQGSTATGATKGFAATINARVRLGEGARLAGKKAGIDAGANLRVEVVDSAIEGGSGPAIAGGSGARLELRNATVVGSPALRFEGRPLASSIVGGRIEGAQVFTR